MDRRQSHICHNFVMPLVQIVDSIMLIEVVRIQHSVPIAGNQVDLRPQGQHDGSQISG